ncbi:hypothetical protein GCM10022284_64510 [Streptomyces hundungensis]
MLPGSRNRRCLEIELIRSVCGQSTYDPYGINLKLKGSQASLTVCRQAWLVRHRRQTDLLMRSVPAHWEGRRGNYRTGLRAVEGLGNRQRFSSLVHGHA